MVQLLSEIEEPQSEYALDFMNDMRKIDPFIVDAYEVLGKERIEELKYNQRKMNEEQILSQRKGNKVVLLIKNTFNIGNKYTNEKITEELTRIFNLLHIHPEKTIKGSMIKDYFQVVEWRNKNNRGYMLVSELIQLMVTKSEKIVFTIPIAEISENVTHTLTELQNHSIFSITNDSDFLTWEFFGL